MKFKTINGLQWAMEDLRAKPNGFDVWEIDGKCYFAYYAAQREAKKQGLKVPLACEWMELCKSMDFNYDNISKELDLELSGYRNWSDGTIINAGSVGYWWTISNSFVNGDFVYFCSGDSFLDATSCMNTGCCVRCIKD